MPKPESNVGTDFYVLEAERGVITAMRLAPMAIPKVCQIVSASDFVDDAHRLFFSLLVNMNDAGLSSRRPNGSAASRRCRRSAGLSGSCRDGSSKSNGWG